MLNQKSYEDIRIDGHPVAIASPKIADANNLQSPKNLRKQTL